MRWTGLAALPLAAAALLFAVWPAAGDAPWEPKAPSPAVSPFEIERCRAGLELRNDVLLRSDLDDPAAARTAVARNVDRYCPHQ